MSKWLVSIDYPYYPDVEEFDNYEEALEEYNYNLEQAKSDDVFTHNVYLSKVEKEYKNEV